eukprot:TRINITY_DN7590_c2_g1_i1.p3 TRINITY_DN7590_c2_g1~~TRINITY_DN7590_c2_g1_i1.p3  ORF type:complete len:258 (-),score=-18.28 TRINITY_DN7590_c2_g1_i1:484-1257(-)
MVQVLTVLLFVLVTQFCAEKSCVVFSSAQSAMRYSAFVTTLIWFLQQLVEQNAHWQVHVSQQCRHQYTVLSGQILFTCSMHAYIIIHILTDYVVYSTLHLGRSALSVQNYYTMFDIKDIKNFLFTCFKIHIIYNCCIFLTTGLQNSQADISRACSYFYAFQQRKCTWLYQQIQQTQWGQGVSRGDKLKPCALTNIYKRDEADSQVDVQYNKTRYFCWELRIIVVIDLFMQYKNNAWQCMRMSKFVFLQTIELNRSLQ